MGNLGALELVDLLHQPALRSRHIHRAEHLTSLTFSPFSWNQILHFSLPLTPLFHPLSTHYPSSVPTALEG